MLFCTVTNPCPCLSSWWCWSNSLAFPRFTLTVHGQCKLGVAYKASCTTNSSNKFFCMFILCPYVYTSLSQRASPWFKRQNTCRALWRAAKWWVLYYLNAFLVILLPQNQLLQGCPLLTPTSLWRLCVLEKPPFSPKPELLHTLTCHLLPGRLTVQLTPKWNLKGDFITVLSDKGLQRQWI